MINKDIGIGVGGFFLGAIATTIVGYFAVYRRYIPLNKIQDEVNALEEQRLSKCRQLDKIDEEFKTRKKEYDDALSELDERMDTYENDISAMKNQMGKMTSGEYHDGERFILPSEVDELVDNDEDEDEEPSDEPVARTDDGRIIIDDGNPRYDGPLSPEEMEKVSGIDDSDRLDAYLTEIKEQRFVDSIDPDRVTYQISEEEYANSPDFIDNETLDYYEKDNILASGPEIVPVIEDLIDPIVLNSFGKNSRSSDPNVVYCRNDKLRMDYVIEWDPGSYQHAIYGVPEEDVDAYDQKKE